MKEIRRLTITTTRRLRLSALRANCPACGCETLLHKPFFRSRQKEKDDTENVPTNSSPLSEGNSPLVKT